MSWLHSDHPWAIRFFSFDTIFGFFIQYDTISIQYLVLRKDLLFEEFSANFQKFLRIFWNFGEFSEISDNNRNFRRIFGISGEFRNFRRIYGGKRQNKSLALRISRYSILEVRYDILINNLKSPIYRHSIISRYDKLIPGIDDTRYWRFDTRYSLILWKVSIYDKPSS